MSALATARARAILKIASKQKEVGAIIGRALKGTGRMAKGVLSGAGEVGAGVAEGMGVDPLIGKVVGVGAVGAAGATGAGRAKRRYDEWRYRNGFY